VLRDVCPAVFTCCARAFRPDRAGATSPNDPAARTLLSRKSVGLAWPPHDPLSRGRRSGRRAATRRSTCVKRHGSQPRPARMRPVRLRSPDHTRGRGPLHPIFREEDRDLLMPEVPSIDELPGQAFRGLSLTMPCAGFRPRHRAFTRRRPRGRAPSPGCHQPVENARRLSTFDPAGRLLTNRPRRRLGLRMTGAGRSP